MQRMNSMRDGGRGVWKVVVKISRNNPSELLEENPEAYNVLSTIFAILISQKNIGINILDVMQHVQFTTEEPISRIDTTICWYFNKCQTCGRKVTEESPHLQCQQFGSQRVPNYRFHNIQLQYLRYV